MSCKRITISLTEEQYDNFRAALPAKANISEVVCDMIDKFIVAVKSMGMNLYCMLCATGASFRFRRKVETDNFKLYGGFNHDCHYNI